VTLDRIETAMMAAEHAARAVFLEHKVDLTALVLNVTFNTPSGVYAAGSKVPDPAPEFLASSLHESATEAGWTPLLDMLGSECSP
jgi:hypothetical protein